MASRPVRRQRTNGRPSAARRADPRVERAIQNAISGGEIVAVGVLHLVRDTVVTVLAGAQDVGAEIGAAAVAAVRGSIKAAHEHRAPISARWRVSRSAGRSPRRSRSAASWPAWRARRRAAPSRPPATSAVTSPPRRGAPWRAASWPPRSSASTCAPWPRAPPRGPWRRRTASAARPVARVRATLSGTVAGMRSLVADVAPAARKRGPRGRAAKTVRREPKQGGDRAKSTQRKDGARAHR